MENQSQERDAIQQEETIFGLPAWIFQTGSSFVVETADEVMASKPKDLPPQGSAKKGKGI